MNINNTDHQIVHYTHTNGEEEYIVIVSPGTDPEEFLRDGFKVESAHDVSDDLTSLPCDRELNT